MINGPSDPASRIHLTEECRAMSGLSWVPFTSGNVRRNHRSDQNRVKWFFAAVTMLLTIGCSRDSEQDTTRTQPATPPPPLTVLILDDPPLAEAIERQWAARADGRLQIQQTTTADLLSERRRHLAADAVIFPSWLIGELAEQNLISPIPAATLNSPEFGRRDIFDLIRQSEIVWGERVFAVPLGSPVLTLLYRRDIFEAIDAKPPETWGEYQKLVQQLADPLVRSKLPIEPSGPWYPVVEPLGDGWASQMLLARAAGYSRHRNYYSTLFDSRTMEPLIAGPPFVRALEELVAVHQGQSSEMLAFGPADARRELIAGRCAMAITWPSRVEDRGESDASTGLLPLAAAELPGSREVFNLGDQKWHPRSRTEDGRATLLGVAGRIGAVSSFSRQPQAALNLLVSLSSTDWSEQVSPFSESTGLYRSSQIPLASSWLGPDFETARSYGELVRDIHRRSLWLTSLRIPGRSRYLTELDKAVQAAVAGDLAPAEALESVADQWREITEELGIETQRTAYWRSLGMEP
ncbi:MAG: extracellular solute-binding protein [Planctomycetaceae bacterium]|nr:MAG: extracellular solute-binding protein [Planctomycetaceae bacterium]